MLLVTIFLNILTNAIRQEKSDILKGRHKWPLSADKSFSG